MDPISAVAAISSFISVAGALQKFVKKLERYLKSFMHAVSEIAALVHEVWGFSLQPIVLQETLEGLPEKLQQSVSRRNVDQYHLDGTWNLVDGFKKLLLALKPLRGSVNANVLQKTYARFKWLQTKTKAELFRASLNSSTCSLNLFVSTVILMGISYEIAGAQRSRERLPEGQSEGQPAGQTEGQPEGPSPRASGTPSDVPLGNHTEPSVAPPEDKIRRLESKLETLKRQVEYEQDKTELVFEACQQLYKKHAAEKNEMRVMARYINASLAMAKDARMSGRGRMAELEVEWEASRARQRMMRMERVQGTSRLREAEQW